jgi:TonB family protein
MHAPRKKNSSKVNLSVSVVFHAVIIVIATVFAAHEGMLGKKLQTLTATIVPKEKKPEPPKPKPEEPKPVAPKPAEAPKLAAAPPPRVEAPVAPAPSGPEAPLVVPPSASLPAFEFNDGAKDVQTTTDPAQLYKGYVEYTLRTRWSRPEDIQDAEFVAEVNVSIDAQGRITTWDWLRGSGNSRWDASVREVMAQTQVINRPPPKGFPAKFVVRFDVESQRTEPAMQLGGN